MLKIDNATVMDKLIDFLILEGFDISSIRRSIFAEDKNYMLLIGKLHWDNPNLYNHLKSVVEDFEKRNRIDEDEEIPKINNQAVAWNVLSPTLNIDIPEGGLNDEEVIRQAIEKAWWSGK